MSGLIGQNLGRYQILDLIGEGGMATVYKAHDARLERDVAIKIIRREAFPPDSLGTILKRFEREAKSLGGLSHPNIVGVIDYGEFEGLPYLVMVYLPGGTLKNRLGKPMPWRDAIRFIIPIARALEYTHEKNIINRDVKPSNILLTEKGQPMLTDFGLVKIFEKERGTHLTTSGTGLGTPDYMAPEQWTGEATPQSDLYSLGIVLYEMITGIRPFTSDTPAGVLLKQATESPPLPRSYIPELPQYVEAVLLKALAKEIYERYPDMHTFGNELQKLLDSKETTPIVKKLEVSREKTGVEVEKLSRSDMREDMVIPIKSISVARYKDIFYGRDKEFNQFLARLLLSKGGTFCIAGYPGVGKTTFADKVVEELRSSYEQDQSQILVSVKIKVPKDLSPTQLMHLLIRRLYEQIRDLSISRYIDTKLMQSINLASDRISALIEDQRVVNNGLEGSIGIGNGNVSTGVKAIKNSQSGVKISFREYDASQAEIDLISILKGLNSQLIKTGWLQKKKHLRVLFVIDELDKIENVESLDRIVRSLKMLFVDSETSFVFIVGRNQYSHWMSNKMQVESIFDGVASEIGIYLPCIWNIAEYALEEMVDFSTVKVSDSSINTMVVFNDFMKYLSYQVRGVPRRLAYLGEYIVISSGAQSASFVFSAEQIRRFHFYSELYEWAQNMIERYVPKRIDFSIVDADSFRRGFFNLVDLILLDLGNDWFTVMDLANEILKSADWMLRYLSEDILVSLLNDLTGSEYLVVSDGRYRLHSRRFYEIGTDRNVDVNDAKSFVSKNMKFGDGRNFNLSNTFTRLDVSLSKLREADSFKLVLENVKGTLFLKGEADPNNKLYLSKSVVFEEKFDIGRSPENDLQLNDPLVSRYHLRLIRSGEKWQIMDMNTANGTYVNSQRLHQNKDLSTGDIISIGGVKLLYVLKDL